MFAKRELENEIKGAPTKSKEEREQMLELLRRFEEEDAKGEENEEEHEDELALRLSSIDLESASHEEIWATLTPEERTRFTRALHNPDSDLMKELLSSEVIEQIAVTPWWEPDEKAQTTTSIVPQRTSRARQGPKPDLLHVPAHLIQNVSAETALALVYNTVCISIAYAYVTRHLSISPLSQASDNADRHEVKHLIGHLVPFLVNRKSQVRHIALQSVITDIWGRIDQRSATSSLISLLLDDAARLVYPTILSELPDTTADDNEDGALMTAPCQNLLLCLSDLHALFDQGQSKRDAAVVHKLMFYAAHMSVVPTAIWQGLSEQLSTRARRERKGEI